MKVLHTADWHLGKKLENAERYEEQKYFLDWLLQILSQYKIDVLLVSGDVFDTSTPSNKALELYYNFLAGLSGTNCQKIIITGGNHDSVSTLNSPKNILKALNVEVIGGSTNNISDELITVYNQKNEAILQVLAVPFLRDRDVKISVAGETAEEKDQRIIAGIENHYQQLFNLADANLPKIAMGHLYVSGAQPSDSERDILVGGLGQFPAAKFPPVNYVALGHLHRPQLVGHNTNIRYSGSPYPLSFSESKDQKSVILLNFEDDNFIPEEIKIPNNRKLIRIKGDLLFVKKHLSEYSENDDILFKTWAEIQLETNEFLPDIETELSDIVAENGFIESLFIRQIKTENKTSLADKIDEFVSIDGLDIRTVFQKKLETIEADEDKLRQLNETFNEALVLMHQNPEPTD